MAGMKRVITCVNIDGKSVVQSADVPQTVAVFEPGFILNELWKLDAPPVSPLAGHDPERYELEPGGRAILFRTFTIPPDSEVLPHLAEIRARVGPNAGINLENEADYGLHRTSTIDFICVVAGEIHLRLDSGDDVCLSPGDCVVQRGTMHAWRNLSSSPCLMSAVMIGTEP